MPGRVASRFFVYDLEKLPIFAIGGLGRQSDATQDIGETRIAAQSVELRIYFNIH